MNKGLIIGVVFLLLVGGGAYVVMKNKSGGAPSTTAPSGGSGSVFSSIKDALSKSISLECSFTDESGHQTKSYIKNGAVRADITASDPKESGSVIVRDNKIYFWNSQGGFVMSATEGTSAGGGQQTAGAQTASDVLQTMEKNKSSCKPAVVADTLFTPPANVQFQDLSKLMQQAVPSITGTPVPSVNYQQYTPQGQ